MLPEAEPPTAGQSKFCKIMSWTQAQPQRNGNTLILQQKRHNGLFKTLYYFIIFFPRCVHSLGIEVSFSSMSGHEDTGRGVAY